MSGAATTPKPARQPRDKVKHQVWVTFTVFVKKEGEKHPWYRHGRGQTLSVAGVSHDQAFYLGERELAIIMADKFKLAGRAS